VSGQAINLTLTIYIIFQAISPVIFGPLSDKHGHRPLFALTLLIYTIGNLGLAFNGKSYAALLVFLGVQSLGASAAFALVMGVVGDVTETKEGGRYLGPLALP
jgi:MFS family permease